MRLNEPTAERFTVTSRRARLFLIMAAAILHVSVTATVFMVGNAGWLPGQLEHDGLGNFASDGSMYRTEILELCGVLRNQGVVAWLTWPTQLHVRLYSLPVAVLNGGTSFNILVIEPLNLIYYLAILVLIFKLSKIVFNHRTGLMAAVTVALWPTLLLHTTQLLRDPLLIAVLLLLVLSLALCLKREYAWCRGIQIGVVGAATIVLVGIVRPAMWSMLWVLISLAVLFLTGRLVRQRRFLVGNVIVAAMIIAAMMISPWLQNDFLNQQTVRRPKAFGPDELQQMSVEQITNHRQGAGLQYDARGEPFPSEAGSNIDLGVQFNTKGDVIRHLPRALVIGLVAPFPNMWFDPGKQVGAAGRRLSGFETLVSYGIQCLALFGLWRERRNLSAWFLFAVIISGALGVGLVIANIGTLYRVRYPFWALLVILGASGADHLIRRRATSVRTDHSIACETSSSTSLS
jgi:putative peptidoglycan lipid II flippase